MARSRAGKASTVRRVVGGALRRTRPAGRRLWYALPGTGDRPKNVVFIVGSQRSGTNMVMRVLTGDPATRGYNEDDPVAFRRFRLRSPRAIRLTIRATPERTILFKPLCDSQWTDRLLDTYEGSRAIWIFRHYNDVANSAVERWHEGERAPIRDIYYGRFDKRDWFRERLSPHNLEVLREVYRDDISLHECAVLVWYVRNSLFFELGLETDQRVRLVRYEDLVLKPSEYFPGLCTFVGCRYSPASARIAHAASIGKASPPVLDPRIRALAEGMLRRLQTAYDKGHPPGTTEASCTTGR